MMFLMALMVYIILGKMHAMHLSAVEAAETQAVEASRTTAAIMRLVKSSEAAEAQAILEQAKKTLARKSVE